MIEQGKQGLFIVLEGPEGAGKSCQIDRISGFLAERDIPHVTTREPGGTSAAEAIREVILNHPALKLDGMAELFLFSASRYEHLETLVRPSLARGEVVLCDRFELSTRVYQGFGRGVSQEAIRTITAEATGGLLPDLYLVLDVPISVGRVRQEVGGNEPDRIELEKSEFMERVRGGYQTLATKDDCTELIDASGSPSSVEKAILRVLASHFPNVFGDAS
jgi:dTMP kinase